MKNQLGKCAVVLIVMSGLGMGCSHNKPKEEAPSTDTSAATNTEMGSSDNGNAMGLQTVHFSYDSSLLDGQSKAILVKNAGILKSHASLHVQIEGYCDNRGGIQYNIALGEKRAKSVQHFLQDHGVQGNRLTVVSFGKEKPLDPAETEEAYAKNRRANFNITAQ